MTSSDRSPVSRAELAAMVAVVGILATLAIPGWRRSRMSGNESAAVATLRAINAAQVSYAGICGRNGYATQLSTLGIPAPGSAQPFLAPELAVPGLERDGFRFRLTAGFASAAGGPDCNGTGTATGYFASAEPVAFGSTGTRAFSVNTAGTIWQTASAGAPAEPFSAPATPIQ